MLYRFLAILSVLALTGSHVGATPTNANVNVTVTTRSETVTYISEVEIFGPGGGSFTYSDPLTAPGIANPDFVLLLTSIGLGLPPGTVLSPSQLVALPTSMTFEEIVTSNFNPLDNPTLVIGPVTEYTNWIAIGNMDVEVEVEQVTYFLNPYRLTASILSANNPAMVPLPASLGFGLLALGALGLIRRKS